jgi:hypothetical protein
MWFLLIGALAHAGALVGVDIVPFGRADEAWVQEQQLSGTQVAETDGLLQPPVTAWGGYANPHHAFLGGLSMARTSTYVDTAKTGSSTTRMGIRPSFDYRWYWVERAAQKPLPYFQVGLHGVIPIARDRADDATSAEQKVLDARSKQDRSRIGGIGGRLGVGTDVQWNNGLVLGARYSVVYHRSRALDEETITVSSLLRAEAALVLAFAF